MHHFDKDKDNALGQSPKDIQLDLSDLGCLTSQAHYTFEKTARGHSNFE